MNKILLKTYKNYIAMALLIAIFFIFDRYLKILATANFQDSTVNLIGNFFSFTFIPNYYIAFSLPFYGPLLNISIGLVIIVLISYLYFAIWKEKNILLSLGLLIMLLGAISNFLDRLSLGYVVDYLSLQYFTIFNLADVGISTGAILSLIAIFKEKKTQKNRAN